MPCDYSNSNQQIYGLVRDTIVGQFDRVDELNTRIQSRQFPDLPLQPAFSSRPVSTKYNTSVSTRLASVKQSDSNKKPAYVMPIDSFNTNPIPTVNVQPYIDHNVQMNFNPATRNGPWRTYINNIDIETTLQNRVDKLVSLDIQGYVPSLDSDLYNTYIVSRPAEQKYGRVFDKQSYITTVPKYIQKQSNNQDRTRFSTNTRPKGI